VNNIFFQGPSSHLWPFPALSTPAAHATLLRLRAATAHKERFSKNFESKKFDPKKLERTQPRFPVCRPI
jgi:hypothetical protein